MLRALVESRHIVGAGLRWLMDSRSPDGTHVFAGHELGLHSCRKCANAVGPGEKAQLLRVHAALTEDQVQFPAPLTLASAGPNASGLLG